ncbi:MAG: membrane protein insertase YidC, partial [Pseudomonadota bacterium]
MDDQNKNLILATALSFLVILVWFILFPPPPPPTAPQEQTAVTTEEGAVALPPADAGTVSVPGTLPATPEETRAAAAARTERIAVETPRLTGSISLTGGRIDDLSLLDYREELPEESPIVTYLSPAGGPDAYYAVHGWAGARGLGADAVPSAVTEWQRESPGSLTPNSPVRLVWDNGAGLIFRKTIAVDENYMFTVTQSVENTTDEAVAMFPYGILARQGEPDLVNFFVLHEGLVAAADGELTEMHYSDIIDLDVDPLERTPAEKTQITETGW